VEHRKENTEAGLCNYHSSTWAFRNCFCPKPSEWLPRLYMVRFEISLDRSNQHWNIHNIEPVKIKSRWRVLR
jgi:hypothetical protein